MRPIIFVCGVVLLLSIAIGMEIEAAEAEQGKQLYVQYCGSCHGKDGRGNGSVSPLARVDGNPSSRFASTGSRQVESIKPDMRRAPLLSASRYPQAYSRYRCDHA